MPDATAASGKTPARTAMTAAQEGIWYAQQLDPGNPTYQIGQYIEFTKKIDAGLLSIAWTKTIRDIDALCLRFDADDNGPFAIIERPEAEENLLDVVDLRSLDESAAHTAAHQQMNESLNTVRPIDSSGLCGAVLFQLPAGKCLLFQRVHHIMLDGYAAVMVLHYLARVYSELSRRVPSGVSRGRVKSGIARIASKTPSPFPSHEELLADLREYRHSIQYEKDLAYWTEAVVNDSSPEGLQGVPAGPAREVVRLSLPLSTEETAPLRALGRDLPRTVTAVFGLYLSRMTGREDISVGLPVTARRGRIAKSSPTMLSNILPLHLTARPGHSIEQMISRTGEAIRGAAQHQRFRLEDLPGTPAMAGPSVNFLPVIDDLAFGKSLGTVHILSTGPVHDLSVVLSGLDSSAAAPTLQMEGDASLYTEDMLQEHGHRLRSALAQVLQDPSVELERLELTTEEESALLLQQGVGPREPIEQRSILEHFETAALQQAEHTAVSAHDGVMSYGQLDEDSSRLAHYLVKQGARPGVTVAVRLERSVNLPLLVLAVLKSGSAYVPLDPEYPIDRVTAMIADAAPVLLLTSQYQAAKDRKDGGAWDVRTVAVDADTDNGWRHCSPEKRTLPAVSPNDLAYVVFTSGSTGRPKGVGVERIALRNLFEEHRKELFEPTVHRLGRNARVAHTAGLSFDAAWDPLLWLFAGHQLHIVDEEARRDPQELALELRQRGIDVIETTPSFVEALLSTGSFATTVEGDQPCYPSVVAVGGEDIRNDLWHKLAELPGVHAINLYGPTETTVNSLITPIRTGTQPHIGGSVRNTRHYVLDSALRPVPDDAVGELYLAGINVARGYVGQPGMSASRFVADPYSEDGTRMYRTGDVVRRRKDGSLRFVGRSDDQVKIRGYRVELGEVETALSQVPGVSRAAAVIQGSGPSARLTGYITPSADVPEEGPDGHQVREALRPHLPEYMVPSAVLILDELPLTTNGKLDRKSLPAPHTEPTNVAQRPRTALERRVAEEFAAVLGINADSLGIDDDFFAAGGHSLLATQLASQLSDLVQSPVRVRDLFERPTVASFVARLEDDDAQPTQAALRPRIRPSRLPVSPTQRRLWFLTQLEPSSAAYNIPVVLHIAGSLDVPALRAALHDVVSRHEPLRTVFPIRDGEPEQHILSVDDVEPTLLAVNVPEDRLEYAVTAEAVRPFDITSAIPLRTALFSASPTDHRLVIVMHHIASDGWSLAPFARDLSEAYGARRRGGDPEFTELPVTYADFSLWQRERLGELSDNDSEATQQVEFWRERLSGAPAEISLPRDRPRGEPDTGPGVIALTQDPSSDTHERTPRTGVDSIEQYLSSPLHDALNLRANDHRVSLFMVLHTALSVALKQHGAGEDVVIGTPVAGREDAQLNDLVGFFVNTVALRTSLDQDPELGELLSRVRESDLNAYAHQDLPFDAVVDAVNPPRIPDMHPVFQVMLTLQNVGAAAITLDGTEVTVPSQMTSAGVKTDLMMDVDPAPDGSGGLRLRLSYDQSLFDRSTAERILDSHVRALQAMAENPTQRLSEVPSSEPETLTWVEEHSVGPHVQTSGTILDALLQTAELYPDSPAAVDSDKELSFKEFTRAVRRGAIAVKGTGAQRGDRVLIALPRGVDALISVYACLQAGVIAVPVDMSYPPHRIAQIVSGAVPRAAFVDTPSLPASLHEVLTQPGRPPHLLDPALWKDTAAEPDTLDETTALPDAPRPEDTAYLVYTSGTTGTPKAVQVSHRALQNVFTHHLEHLIEPHRLSTAPRLPRMLHLSGLGFDAAWDPLLWLAGGTTVRIPTEEQRVDAQRIVDIIAAENIDVLETTPSYVQQLLAVGLSETLRQRNSQLTVAVGGEPVDRTLWQHIAQSSEVSGWNLYGPSEFTIDSVVSPIAGADPHIGRPIGNVTARVLDSSLTVVPPGVEGELYLSGMSEAEGYRDRPAETASRFVPDPWSMGTRMYRTGDIVRRRPDGTLDFLRRDDDQVKLRGHRIELGEVATVLSGLDAVETAIVRVSQPGGPETALLAAWVVTSREPASLRDEAARLLPEYMVPTRIVPISSVPLTTHGKVDDAALPDPHVSSGESVPSSETEQAICHLMGDVLGVRDVAPDDDFFALGGHSMLAVSLMGALRRDLGADIPLRTIFEKSTPRGLLSHISAGDDLTGHNNSSPSEELSVGTDPRRQILEEPLSHWAAEHPRLQDEHLPLTAGQRRLWFLNRLDPSSAEYNVVLQVQLDGELDTEAMSSAMNDLVTRHEILRTSYPVATAANHRIHPGAEPSGDRAEESRPAQHIHEAAVGTLGNEPLDPALGFDLTVDTPLRAALVPIIHNRWRLELVIHHIATDGASLVPLVRDLSAAYAARVCGGKALRRPLRVQFADVARREEYATHIGLSTDPAMGSGVERWAERLHSAPEELTLPGAGRRTDSAHQPAGQQAFTVPASVAGRLTRIAASRHSSSFHGWLAALAGFLHRAGAGDDIVVGSPSAGRTDPDVQDLIGFFVNTLPLRLQLDEPSTTFLDLLDQARERTVQAIDDEHVPFEQIVERLNPTRQLGRHPLFQTMLSLEEPSGLSLELPGVTTTPLEPGTTGSAKMDLSFTIRPGEDPSGTVHGVLEYNAAVFSAASIRAIIHGWITFLSDVTASPESPIGDAPMRGTSSSLRPWQELASSGSEHGPTTSAPRDLRPEPDARLESRASTLLETLDETTERAPDQLALVAEDRDLTFAELHQRVAQLSRGLSARGVSRHDIVALCLPRSADTIVAMLAVWRAGGIALPIDASLPEQRVSSMLSASAVRTLIHGDDPVPAGRGTSTDLARSAALSAGIDEGQVISITAVHRSGEEHLVKEAAAATSGEACSHDAAYLIFTSGTTGTPKGVQVPHAALSALLHSHRSSLMPDASRGQQRIAHTTGVGFDAAMDPLLWLVAGHQVHVIDDETRRNPQALGELFATRRITAWETTPSYVNALLAHSQLPGFLRRASAEDPFTMLLGGEPVDPGLWALLRDHEHVQAWNLYGPTEAGVDTLIADVSSDATPVLGAPTAHTRAYVLDDRLRPAPDGTVGELWLAGAQLAHGYLGRADDTAAAFVADPFAADGSRMYRTGDLVMIEPARSSEDPSQQATEGPDAYPSRATGGLRVRMLGRADSQVKIRGYRVEPSEVEALLREVDHVADAVVRPQTGARGTELSGWVVPAESGSGDAGIGNIGTPGPRDIGTLLKRHLSSQLPGYMVPSSIQIIEQIPLTPSGKVDDRALPAPQPEAAGSRGRGPETGPEKAVAGIFEEILDVTEVSVADTFFELGGHSFLAQPVISAINAQLSSDLPVQAIFQSPSVESLAAAAVSGGASETDSLRPLLPLRSSGPGAPLFAIHPGSGLSWAFSTLLAHVQTERPVLGVQMHGIAPDQAPSAEPGSFQELISWYIDTIKEQQSAGPYHLLGWSFGGRLAHAVAAELQARGDHVESLTILDAYPSTKSTAEMTDEQDFWRAFLRNKGQEPGLEEPLNPQRAREMLHSIESPMARVPEEAMARMMRRFTTIGTLMDASDIPLFDGDIHLVEATHDVPESRPAPEAWAPYVSGDVHVEQVPAAHESLLESFAVEHVAAALNRWAAF